MDDFPLHDGDIEPNPEDRKSGKRSLSPLKEDRSECGGKESQS
jgi:hypothetical protein